MKSDIEEGMYFDSIIPQGYGVGSSGALVAAIYERYALNKIEIEQEISKEIISELKEVFSKMESFFHGTSSGIDPLICYLNLQFLINPKINIQTIVIPEKKKGKGPGLWVNSCAPG